MKSPGHPKSRNLWTRFYEDERASAQSCWGVLVFLVWIATESLLTYSG
ncbi:MAG: hypothetical protein KDA84_30135 [Planctomycetaceae bacterium]|nr:hypothetical protein [Planctomycetaceae bacterium]